MRGKDSKNFKVDTNRRGLTIKQDKKPFRIVAKTIRNIRAPLSCVLVFCFLSTAIYPGEFTLQTKDLERTNKSSDIKQNSKTALTKKDLPPLKAAVTSIKNQQYKKLTQKLVSTIEEKGKISRDEIDRIAAGSNVTIRVGCVIRTVNNYREGYCEGTAYSYPGTLRMLSLGFINKGGIVQWYGQGGGYVDVSGTSNFGKGVAIGYVG
jgi:hypothetical protein